MKKAVIILTTCTGLGAVIGATFTSLLCKQSIENAKQNGWLKGVADGIGFANTIYNYANSSDSDNKSDNETSKETES